jgi:hypothetical protein
MKAKKNSKARKQVKQVKPALKPLSPPAYRPVNRGPESHKSRWLPNPEPVHAEGIGRRAA